MNGKFQVYLGLGNARPRPRSSKDRIARRCDTAINLCCNALRNCQALPGNADGGLGGLHINIGKLNVGNDLKSPDNRLCQRDINLTVSKSDPRLTLAAAFDLLTIGSGDLELVIETVRRRAEIFGRDLQTGPRR